VRSNEEKSPPVQTAEIIAKRAVKALNASGREASVVNGRRYTTIV